MEPAKPQLRLIKLPEVKNRTGESTAKIYDRMADGTFPLSVTTGPNSRAWVEHEIDEWIQARIAARDSGADAELRAVSPNIGKGRPRKDAPSETARSNQAEVGQPSFATSVNRIRSELTAA